MDARRKRKLKFSLEIGPGDSPVTLRKKNRESIMLDNNLSELKYIGLRSDANLLLADASHIPLKKESVSEIDCRMFPAFEFFDLKDAEKMVREAKRALKERGTFTLSVPDYEVSRTKKLMVKNGFELSKVKLMTNPKKMTTIEKDLRGKNGLLVMTFKKKRGLLFG